LLQSPTNDDVATSVTDTSTIDPSANEAERSIDNGAELGLLRETAVLAERVDQTRFDSIQEMERYYKKLQVSEIYIWIKI